jgi:methylated-DNA-[protein]-cysteine S-methyltransferase
VTSYADIARRIGNPNSVRAVGAANGANPVAIVVPCHRVVGSDRTLTGYAGGLDIKRRLLALEGIQVDGRDRVVGGGGQAALPLG